MRFPLNSKLSTCMLNPPPPPQAGSWSIVCFATSVLLLTGCTCLCEKHLSSFSGPQHLSFLRTQPTSYSTPLPVSLCPLFYTLNLRQKPCHRLLEFLKCLQTFWANRSSLFLILAMFIGADFSGHCAKALLQTTQNKYQFFGSLIASVL